MGGFLYCLIWSSIVLCSHYAQGTSFTVEQWNAVEIELTAVNSYSKPYIDVDDLIGIFLSSSGLSMEMPGFWDGGQTWKIRFAPTSVGLWTYQTKGRDGGLNNKTGFILCTPYTGTLSIYEHGFIKPSANNRYLTYADSKPFYWLGDTHWSGFSIAERLNSSNDIRFSSMFKGMIDRRVQQGFTVWKGETFANNNEGGNPPHNEGGPAWYNQQFFIDLNPGFWQNIDLRIQYLASKGMVISMAQGIGRGMKNASLEPDCKRLARYILARYGAYPTVWITVQEYNDVQSGACGACWARVAAYVYDLDPYKRANSMHNAYTNIIAYHDQPWYGFVTLQQSHNHVSSVDYWLAQYNAMPPRPILEDEANYEDIIPSYGGGVATPKWKTRQSAWQSQIAGTFGFTYGAQGIWWACYTVQDPNPNCGDGNDARAWNTGIDFPVGEQMSYMANFWTSVDWWTLTPDADAISWLSAPSDTQKPYQKTDGSNRSLIIAYLPLQLNGTIYNGTVQNLSPTALYTAQWFNPRNGTYSVIEAGWMPRKDGRWNIPYQPTASDDWVLKIQLINGSNTSPNYALGSVVSTSSAMDFNHTSAHAIDDDLTTYWQPRSIEGFDHFWLVLDFSVNITFNQVQIIEQGSHITRYHIEFWNGTLWSLVHRGSAIEHRGVTFTAVTGSHMRLIFTSDMAHMPMINELRVFYTEEE